MANFDEDIKRITEQVLADGTVDNIIREKVTKGFENAITDAFRWGDLQEAIKNKVKGILVPFIESYDMSRYLIKLDQVLTELVNQTTLIDNKEILEGFRYMMSEPQIKEIKVSELFKEYKNFVERNMETSGRGIDCDCGEVEYEPMWVNVTFEKEEEKIWSSFEYATLDFYVNEEEQAGDLNRTVRLSRWKNDKKEWGISVECDPTVSSLRYLDKFDLFLIKLQRANVRLIIDIENADDYVYSENKPEAIYE